MFDERSVNQFSFKLNSRYPLRFSFSKGVHYLFCFEDLFFARRENIIADFDLVRVNAELSLETEVFGAYCILLECIQILQISH